MNMWGALQLKYPLAFAIADKLTYALLMLLSVLVAMVYHPAIMGMESAEVVLHGAIAFVFLLLFLLSQVDKFVFSSPVINITWLLFAITGYAGLMVYALYDNSGMKAELRSLVIPICAMMVGWQLKMDEKRLVGLILTYTMGVVVVGVSQLFMQGDGFHITELYFMEQKNALGPMVSIAVILCVNMAITATGHKRIPLILLGFAIAIFCVTIVLTLRARAAILAMVLIVALMLFQRYRGENLLLSILGALVLAFAVFLILPQAFKEYAYQSLFSGFTNGDITSGRMARNQQVLHVLADNPLLGYLASNKMIAIPHNYLLCKMYEYGFLFALPILSIYFFLLYTNLKKVIADGMNSLMNVGSYAVLALFLISMFEYTYPFGPGTTTMLCYVLFGVSLKHTCQRNTTDGKVNEKTPLA